MLRFPYPYRPHQKDIIGTISSALAGKKHVVMESGTGTGKTVCTLYAAYSYATKHGKKLIYTTRTNSQHHQVITETKSINMASQATLCAVGFQGRNNFCLLLKDMERIRREARRAVLPGDGEGEREEETPTTIEELAAYCAKRRRFTKDKIERELKDGAFVRLSLAEGVEGRKEEGVGDNERFVSLKGTRNQVKGRGCIYYENLLRGGVPAKGESPDEEQEDENRDDPAPSTKSPAIDEDDSIFEEEEGNIFVDWVLENCPDTAELLSFCRANDLCPYELNKMACEKADAVVVPYIFFFAPFLRYHLLDWMNVKLKDVVLVVDEAHNLPDYARELQSSTLSRRSLELVVAEGKKYGVMNVSEELSLPGLCRVIGEAMDDFLENYLVDEDGLIPDFELEERILGHFKIPSPRFKQVAGSIIKMGIAVKEQKLNVGRLPSSHIYSFGNFLLHWLSSRENHYIRLINRDGNDEKTLKREHEGEGKDEDGDEFESGTEEEIYFVKADGSREKIGIIEKPGKQEQWRGAKKRATSNNPHIELFCLDPSITTSIANECHMSIHMSGTLKPMEQYVDSIGLAKERLQVRSFPSPFPEKNRRFIYAGDVTTRYEDFTRDPTIKEKIGGYLKEIALQAPGRNTIFFFPSFKLLHSFSSRGRDLELQRPVFVERQKMSNDEHHRLLQDFKRSEGGLLFSVVGGRTSEGMDFPGKELEIVVVVGIPYPKPTIKLQALQFYNEEKFRQGYFYTFHAPASRKLAQALGRLIRTETDRGLGIILDKRAHRFSEYIYDMEKSEDIVGELGKFEFGE